MNWITEIMNPRWMMKFTSSELRMYDSRPCQNNSVFRSRNSLIEKSAASAACIPSFPTMPTPTSAAWIMPTSFPPSPMPSTASLNCLWRLTPAVSSFFWLGEQRQQMMVGICMAVRKKSSESSCCSSTKESVLLSMSGTWLGFSLTFSQCRPKDSSSAAS